MRTAKTLTALAVILAGGLAACRSSNTQQAQMRPAVNTPAHFSVVESDTTRAARPNEGCRSPLADPSSGTRLVLVRSSGGHGDYSVPGGAYGVTADELLRVDCTTGTPLGIVPN